MTALYRPPYDSPIEDAFAMHYTAHAPSSITFEAQVHVSTICGLFILDFLITTQTGLRIAIECDGKEFHNESRDEWRDAMILGGNHVDAVYRLRGSDIHYSLEDLMCLLCRLEPTIFDERSVRKLKSLASEETLETPIDAEHDIYSVRFPHEHEMGFMRIEVRRKDVQMGIRKFWKTAHAFGLDNIGMSLDTLIHKYRSL